MKRIKKFLRDMKINTRITLSCIGGIFTATLITGLAELYLEHNFPEIQDELIEILSHPGFTWTLIAIGLIFAIILVSYITSKTIVKPINMFCDGVREISNGNLDYKIDYYGKNELGITAEAFNEMTDKLKESMDALQAVEKSRKQLIAGVTHDLRTPLTTIKGYTEGLRDGIANTPEKQHEYLQTIYYSALDMQRLLDELLNVSNLETGKIELNFQPCNLYEYLTEYMSEASYLLEKKGVEFSFEASNFDKETAVMLDPDRFLRVLSNLMTNAIKYSSKIRQPKIIISLQSYEKSVVITVKDNGIGISKENLPHIFETFFRADQARTRVSNGSGLGLSVCKEIIELHHGKIWAKSTEGEETSIIISLPRISQED